MASRKKKSKKRSDRMVKGLRKNIEKAREREIVVEEDVGDFDGFLPYGVSLDEYLGAQTMKRRLLRKHSGKALEDIIAGEEFKTQEGTCFLIKDRKRVSLKLLPIDAARKRILSELTLLRGIGPATKKALKRQGYRTIEHLVAHPRFGGEASRLLDLADKGDTYSLIGWIGRWFPKSHPIALSCSGFHEKEDFLMIDIESMGLFSRPIIVCGVAQVSGNVIETSQYFARSIAEERAMLAGLLSHFNDSTAIVTFNGRAYDIGHLKERLAYYRMKANLERTHFDVLHFSRRAWGKKLPDCRLCTIERRLLGKDRKKDVPSALVPEFYQEYRRTKNVGPVVPIIEHNKQDLVAVANVFSKLMTRWKWELRM